MTSRNHNGRYITKEVFETKFDLIEEKIIGLRDTVRHNKDSSDIALKDKAIEYEKHFERVNGEYGRIDKIVQENVSRDKFDGLMTRVIALEKVSSASKIQAAFWTLVGVLLGAAILKFMGI